MSKFSKSNTVLYKKLYRESNDSYLFSSFICFVLTSVTRDYYSLPYFAIRKTGIDYIFRTYTARRVADWKDILRLEASVSNFKFIMKSGYSFEIKFSKIDYSSVQLIKDSFSKKGLLVSTTTA